MNVVNFKAGDYLIREMQAGESIYIIKQGQVEVFQTSKNGQKIPLGIIGSGEYVGETAVLLDDNYSSNVVALTNVVAIKLSKSYVEAQLKSVPTWLIALTRGLIDRLRRANAVLKKHGLVDENLSSRVKAIEDNEKKIA